MAAVITDYLWIWYHTSGHHVNHFLQEKYDTVAVQKTGQRKEKDDGKRNSVPYDRSDGGMCRCQGAVSMADLILWAIIEALKADGYEVEVMGKNEAICRP